MRHLICVGPGCIFAGIMINGFSPLVVVFIESEGVAKPSEETVKYIESITVSELAGLVRSLEKRVGVGRPIEEIIGYSPIPKRPPKVHGAAHLARVNRTLKTPKYPHMFHRGG